jgi:2,4-diketo-3-deoxy-L-fuconate hydrolase
MNDVRAFGVGTFHSGTEEFPGLVVDDYVIDIRPILPDITRTLDLFANWDENLDLLASHVDDTGIPMSTVTVCPPVTPGGMVFAAGVNYREHIIEMSVAHKLGRDGASEEELRADAATDLDNRLASGDPYIWTGIPSAMCGAFDEIRLPDFGEKLDWEAELGVVISRRAYRISESEALDYVAGFVIVNDLTARSLVARDDIAKIGTDWFRSKNQPTFFPIGPMIVPQRFIPDWSQLEIKLWLNDELMQDSSTANMAFSVPALLSYASSVAILNPGDVLITGSPAGNGSHWNRFLAQGDVIDIAIDHLGRQRNIVGASLGTQAPWQASRTERVTS